MGPQYPALALLNLLVAGFLAVSTYAFAQGTAVTLGFAAAIGVLATSGTMAWLSFPLRGRGSPGSRA